MHHLTDDLADSRVLDAGRVCDAVARIRGGDGDVDVDLLHAMGATSERAPHA